MPSCLAAISTACSCRTSLEHLPSQDAVGAALARIGESLAAGGRIAVMGPNFRYCARGYFDRADHTLALTHVAVAEHLYAAGFDVTEVIARFLPYSFRGRLPASPRLTGHTCAAPYCGGCSASSS